MKMKRVLSCAIKTISVLLLLVATGSFAVCAHAQTSCISEVTIAVGTEGRASLENSGYTVLFQSMNLVSSDESAMVYLGYKKGSSGITGLLVSTQSTGSIVYEGCTYQLVSGTNLNNGVGGTPLYLYYTKDSAAGSEITSLDTVSGLTSTDEVIALRNDGSAPVRMDDGSLANLDSGISNSEIYLLMYRSENIKRYISNACIVTAGSKKEAVNQAASQGCDYYLDSDIGGSGAVSYIAYQRTSDVSKAITKFSIVDSQAQIEKNELSTVHLLDITSGKLFGDTFSLGDWAGVYASYDRSVSRSSSQYKALLNSTDLSSSVWAGDPDIYALYEGDYAAAAAAEAATEETKEEADSSAADSSAAASASGSETATGSEETSKETAATGSAVDDYYGINKPEDTASDSSADASTVAENGEDNAASVVSRGNTAAIACFVVLLIFVVAGAIIYIKVWKKKK